MTIRAVLCLAASVILASSLRAENWPAWRGLDGQGHTAERSLPTRWGVKENVRWKIPLPDRGNSTPIIWGDRIFLTQAVGNGAPSRRSVCCFDRHNGTLLWQRDTVYPEQEATHATNPYCSASPVTDGERVIASFGSAGMFCYDFDGHELWHKDLGKLVHIWGNGSSPVLVGNLVILWCGPGERQFLLAVDKKTGQTVWEHNEPGGKSGKDGDWIGSWTTPLVVHVADHDELVLGVPQRVKGFNPNNGRELWSCAGLGKLVYTSPVCSANGIILIMSGFHGPALAVRAGGRGDVTATHRLWHHTQKNPQRIGSPVIVGQHAYILNENGLAQCLELSTGKDLWHKERQSSATWGSMVSAGDRLYVTNNNGETFVLKASPEFALIAKNTLAEPVFSSLAIADGELFIRSHKHLWCIGK